MEIKITSFFYNVAPRDLSASVMEIGKDAGKYTWEAALEAAGETRLLDTREKIQAFAKFALASGGWSPEEIKKWSVQETNALFLQWIAGDMREMGLHKPVENPESVDWPAIEAEQENGQIPSTIIKGIDGEIYFYVGS